MNSAVTYLKIKRVSFIDYMQGFNLLGILLANSLFSFWNHRKVFSLKSVASFFYLK